MTGQQAPGREVLLVDFGAGDHGHRGEFNAALARIFPLRKADFSWTTLFSRQPVLVPMIEDGMYRYVLASLLRGLLGFRTAGIMLRPLPAVHGKSLRLRIKRLALKIIKRLPACRVLTMVPFPIEPGISQIANDWFYDLQNWDLQLAPPAPLAQDAETMVAQIRQTAAGRKTVCAIGYQSAIKGFDRFVDLYAAAPQLREKMLFCYGGKVDPAINDKAEIFSANGGCGFNRFVSVTELFALYAAADLVWCYYDPSYDQASGILGRALQLGVPVIARRGSVVQRQCELYAHPHIALDADCDPVLLDQPVEALDIAAARQRALEQGQTSIAVLARALGSTPRNDLFCAESAQSSL